MNRTILPLAALVVLLVLLPSARAVTIDTVLIGNPGNLGDTAVMWDGTTGYGAVADKFRIGTTEVTNAQYAEFLNAKAASDPLGLWTYNMGSPLGAGGGFGGIVRSGSDGSYTYATVPGRENWPVNYVSWYNAARFANWMHNDQGSGSTETGAYTLLGGTRVPSNGLNISRNPGARWFIPTEDEWYKAAYHKNDGATGNYWDYPTKSDVAPIAELPPGGSNSANYAAAVDWPAVVGAYAASASPYGTFDQAGNVHEWNENLNSFGHRGLRGGGWFTFDELTLSASHRNHHIPTVEISGAGFRLAMVPEPSAIALASLAFSALAGYRLSRRKR